MTKAATDTNVNANPGEESKVHSGRSIDDKKKIKGIDELSSVKKYLSRIGAEARGLKSAVVTETVGNKYWREVATIKFDENGEIGCDKNGKRKKNSVVKIYSGEGGESDFEPTQDEEAAIHEELKQVDWPTLLPVKHTSNPPPAVKKAGEGNVFEFRDENGMITMLQVRMEQDAPDGGREKVYIPYTYWSDNEWRCAEPDGPLPLFNAHKLKNAALIYVHEGARTADVMQKMAEAMTRQDRAALGAHPWNKQMAAGVHVGWIGGAMNAHRTDWSPINRSSAQKVIIVADNDDPGRQAPGTIAELIRKPTLMLQPTASFPQGWDMADPWPEKMFAPAPSGNEGELVYVGPALEQMLVPITWATDLVPNPSGKGGPTIRLRQHYKSSVAHITASDHFISDEQPEKIMSRGEYDREMAARSHTSNLSKFVEREFNGRTCAIAYEPGRPPGIIEQGGGMAMNTFRGTSLKPQPGDVQPFLEYLAYMFPNEAEYKEVLRWCATLIGRPHIRMAYALLLISKTQGIGKTTFAEQILRPLVGSHNCSVVTDTQLVDSQFNAWLGSKRLIIVNEIYSGQGWKAYHKSKTIITDEFIEVNQKHERPYTVKNYAHVFACSNSDRAIRMAEEDRRWFIPTVAESKWPREKFAALRKFLERGGLEHILHWAQNFESLSDLQYVAPGAAAPMTKRKQRMIEESRSPLVNLAVELAEAVSDPEGEFARQPVALVGAHIMDWLKNHPENDAKGRGTVRNDEVSIAMASVGMGRFGDRPKWEKRRTFILMNPALAEKVSRAQTTTEQRKIMEEFVRAPHEILPNLL